MTPYSISNRQALRKRLRQPGIILQKPPLNPPAVPWGSATQWNQAQQSISYHLRRYPHALKKAHEMADYLGKRLDALFPILDDLCRNSCPRCPEPCCLTAKVWFDFKDLVYLHFAHKPIPLTPPLSALENSCLYLGHRGCMLPRSSRPWVCTWYLCPTQTTVLRKRDPLQYEAFNRIVPEIKELRKKLEEAFIRVVA